MKKYYVDARNYSKEIVTAALESGADAIICDDSRINEIKSLGIIPTIAYGGDIKLAKDILEVSLKDRADIETVLSLVKDKQIIVRTNDWKIIPLEDLVASAKENIFCYADSVQDARLALGILEYGVAGIVTESESPIVIKEIGSLVKSSEKSYPLSRIKIEEIICLGLGDRVCLDTSLLMKEGQGMLVGDFSLGYFLVHSESIESKYCDTRPFRVNAGAVHSYIMMPDGRTRYLSDLRGGDELLVIDREGKPCIAYLGRSKTEKRPLVMIKGSIDENPVNVTLQNAETIRLVSAEGKPVSIVDLKKGDEVIGMKDIPGRHFGVKIDETILER